MINPKHQPAMPPTAAPKNPIMETAKLKSLKATLASIPAALHAVTMPLFEVARHNSDGLMANRELTNLSATNA